MAHYEEKRKAKLKLIKEVKKKRFYHCFTNRSVR